MVGRGLCVRDPTDAGALSWARNGEEGVQMPERWSCTTRKVEQDRAPQLAGGWDGSGAT